MCRTSTKTETCADPSVGQRLKLVQGDGKKRENYHYRKHFFPLRLLMELLTAGRLSSNTDHVSDLHCVISRNKQFERPFS